MSDAPTTKARKIDHVSFVVESVDEALKLYAGLLGLEVVKVEESELHGVKAAFLKAGDVMVEIIEPLGPGPIQDFLDRRGPGFHHLAYEVPDVPEGLAAAEAAGFRVIDGRPKPGIEGGRIAFLHPKSTFGAMTEMCDKKEFEEE